MGKPGSLPFQPVSDKTPGTDTAIPPVRTNGESAGPRGAIPESDQDPELRLIN